MQKAQPSPVGLFAFQAPYKYFSQVHGLVLTCCLVDMHDGYTCCGDIVMSQSAAAGTPNHLSGDVANMELCTVVLPSGERCMNVGDDLRAAGRCLALHRHPKWAAAGSFVIGRSGGAAAANAVFAALCETDTSAEPYKRRIQHILSAGEVNGGAELVHGIMCNHLTQPSNNCTVWYSWKDKVLTIWGLGSHAGGSGAGNRRYTMTWCDGTSKNWTRPR